MAEISTQAARIEAPLFTLALHSITLAQLFSHLSFSEDSKEASYWPELPLSAAALAICDNLSAAPVLVITRTANEAQEMLSALSFFLDKKTRSRLALFSDYEILPYDVFSPAEDLISERLQVLHRAARGDNLILVTSIANMMHRLPPVNYVTSRSLCLKIGDEILPNKFCKTLVERGYRITETVNIHGEIAIRGSLIDIFAMGMKSPCRIDLFDTEIESIRTFDPETQLTREKISEINILPGREFPLDHLSIQDFRTRWHQEFAADPRNSSVYQSITKGYSPQGIESYLPLFFEQTASLLDYMPRETQLVQLSDLTSATEEFWTQLLHRKGQYSGNLERPLLEPSQLYFSVADCFAAQNEFARVRLDKKQGGPAPKSLPDVAFHYKQENPFAGFKSLCSQLDRLLICAESAGRRELMLETLREVDLHPTSFDNWQAFTESSDKLAICIGEIPSGWTSFDHSIALVAENDLLNERVKQQKQEKSKTQSNWTNSEEIIRNLTELRPAAPVVHIEHGIGRFMGLETLKVNGTAQEFLALIYANDNKLYVPVDSLDLISRYSGADADTAPLHRLGNEQWEKAKRKAREQICDTAAELLEVYAQRQARQGTALNFDKADYQRFCNEFPFEETEDQLTSIAAVETDMASSKPMDRLICGDVGFGKTEIAMRAAFIATSAGKQVVILVPTTLLARQHLETFRDRFANWPVKVDAVSRLKSASEQAATIKNFDEGKLDILIGTHKLLHQDLNTIDLGLLIVDEEHRFGVRQKEVLKSLKAEVDLLTLTATPIPRTLNMAMASIRDLSIIATPPARRLAIKTFVQPQENRVIQEAIQRELMRGGQVYFVHNEIRSIERRAQEITALVPTARIAIAHGQMREQELERIISDFYHQRFDILLCTTIIETGIDIPTANTMIIDRADKFGLAQLHQLRGRVGRSHHQAYAFMLTSDKRSITADAEKRLIAIEEADHLGSGFALATHDLEIRGAGELLGDSQSGQIQAIGFELYQEMLERAVKDIQSGKRISLNEDSKKIEIKLGVPALIPEDYLPDVNTRLQLYKRIAGAKSEEALRQLQIEMIDRFGLLSDPIKTLFALAKLKLDVTPLGVIKIDVGDTSGSITFIENPPLDPMKLIGLVQRYPDQYKFSGSSRLQFFGNFNSRENKLGFLQKLLVGLTSETGA